MNSDLFGVLRSPVHRKETLENTHFTVCWDPAVCSPKTTPRHRETEIWRANNKIRTAEELKLLAETKLRKEHAERNKEF